MIDTVSNPSDSLFYSLVRNSKNTIRLCSPYVHEKTIDRMLNMKQKKTEISLITSANLASFHAGYSDIIALKKLIDAGFDTYNCTDLHANIYLFDNEKAIVTSAPLTEDGFNEKFEYGVLISDDFPITKRISSDLDVILGQGNCSKLNRKTILYIYEFLKNKNSQTNIYIDDEGDHRIVLSDNRLLTEGLSGWQRDIYNILNRMDVDKFVLDDIYAYEHYLQTSHPNNHHIRDKIRQVLQELRERGLIRFVGRGIYKKLWG